MPRIQVQLTKEQSAQVKEIAGQKGVSIAEIVRESVNLYLKKVRPVSP